MANFKSIAKNTDSQEYVNVLVKRLEHFYKGQLIFSSNFVKVIFIIS
jgi:hypothetical protein